MVNISLNDYICNLTGLGDNVYLFSVSDLAKDGVIVTTSEEYAIENFDSYLYEVDLSSRTWFFSSVDSQSFYKNVENIENTSSDLEAIAESSEEVENTIPEVNNTYFEDFNNTLLSLNDSFNTFTETYNQTNENYIEHIDALNENVQIIETDIQNIIEYREKTEVYQNTIIVSIGILCGVVLASIFSILLKEVFK